MNATPSPPYPFRSSFLQEAWARGFIHQCTDYQALDNVLHTHKDAKAYIGFDATADSLHVGSLTPLMMLRLFQKHGHQPIIVMGGGTSLIGDPSGKDTTRALLDKNTIHKNSQAIQTLFDKIQCAPKAPNAFQSFNNATWLEPLALIPFLRDIGRHLSVNRMLNADSVRLRLEREQHLSFLEFNYMVLQAYDFLVMAQQHACYIQMGGSDQWGNITTGIELARKKTSLPPLYGLTMPLLTTAQGAKMGKTAQGAIWLHADKTSVWDYWQFWRNCRDDDVRRCLLLFTDIDVDTIHALTDHAGEKLNDAKKALADATTQLLHGADAARDARKSADATFEKHHIGHHLPLTTLTQQELEHGLPLIDVLMTSALCQSRSDAKRLIAQQAIKINRQTITDEHMTLSLQHFDTDKQCILSKGKKHHRRITYTP
ncbi:MAG: tyrosine--tRNA ligase [Alphaproteobacteria bacterium GM7ARS4]|nr:tyrosine--tRNA ligase [Alphaproteobacteria bacterium GM7ARS4]